MAEQQSDISSILTDGVSLRRLLTFLDVVETLSVTRTAQRTNVRQPAITQQIKALESALGLRLFYRSGRSLSLTESGKKIVPIARRLVAQHQHAIADMQDVVRTVNRELRIGMSSPQTALPFAQAFERRFPHVQLEYVVGNTNSLVNMIDELLLDAAFVGMARPIGRLHCQRMFDQHLVAIVPFDHPWRKRKSVKLKEVAAARLALRETGSFTRELLEGAFETQGLSPRNAFEISTREAVHQAVASGLAVTVVLNKELLKLPGLHAIPVENGKYHGPEFVICHRELANIPPVSMFLESCMLAQVAGKD